MGSAQPTSTGAQYDPVADRWSATSTSGASPTRGHTAVWTGSEMIVFGGFSLNGMVSGARMRPLSLYVKN